MPTCEMRFSVRRQVIDLAKPRAEYLTNRMTRKRNVLAEKVGAEKARYCHAITVDEGGPE